jgi:hypothetical protein
MVADRWELLSGSRRRLVADVAMLANARSLGITVETPEGTFDERRCDDSTRTR